MESQLHYGAGHTSAFQVCFKSLLDVQVGAKIQVFSVIIYVVVILNLESCLIDKMKWYQNLSCSIHLCYSVQTPHPVQRARCTVASLEEAEWYRKHRRRSGMIVW